jgi:4-hydroxybenzoate polyprenyltransferase
LRISAVRDLLIHLRLHFQLLLAPVYLWGWLVSGGGLRIQVLLGFVAFHFFLYSGVTAFNSYYDRDVGPVGGLEHPPPASGALLPFSIGVQLVGLLIAFGVNQLFAAAYCIFIVLSVAYSHPRVRLKAHPLRSLMVVGTGQGALAFFAAWAAARGNIAITTDAVIGALAAVLLILALYPLTQLYQMDEDRSRGDRTVAVAWGPARCFLFSLACTILGGGAMLVVLLREFGVLDVTLVALGLFGQLCAVVWLRRSFKAAAFIDTYHKVMRVNTASAAALSAYLLVRLAV